jgi:hypothetical protein
MFFVDLTLRGSQRVNDEVQRSFRVGVQICLWHWATKTKDDDEDVQPTELGRNDPWSFNSLFFARSGLRRRLRRPGRRSIP